MSNGRTHTTSSFIGGVFDDDIRFVILEIAQREQNDVSLIDPDLRIGERSTDSIAKRLKKKPFSAFSL
jgi:hypothetical protein